MLSPIATEQPRAEWNNDCSPYRSSSSVNPRTRSCDNHANPDPQSDRLAYYSCYIN